MIWSKGFMLDIHVGSIWFTDEGCFNLDDFVNKQNWRICGTENPRVAVLSSLLTKKNGLGGHFYQRTHWRIFQIQNDYCTTQFGVLPEFVAV